MENLHLAVVLGFEREPLQSASAVAFCRSQSPSTPSDFRRMLQNLNVGVPLTVFPGGVAGIENEDAVPD